MRLRWALVAAVAFAPALSGCVTQCTLVGCESQLELELTHALDLSEGPYRLEVTTPLHSLRCSFGPDATGTTTCFGYRFSDLDWDEERVTLSLIAPFYDAESNPEGEPFESVELAVSQGSTLIAERTVEISRGEPQRPNGEGCPPTCWSARGDVTLP